MFTSSQLALINTGQYSVCFNLHFSGLKGSTEIKWTTLPFDYGDYQSENFIVGIDSLATSTGKKDNPVNVSIAGSISMLAAFDKCLGANLDIQIGIYESQDTIYFNSVFSGKITKYGIKRGKSKVDLALEVKDKIASLSMTNSRLLTKEDQLRRVPNDQCLRYMGQSTTAVFWGKEV